MKRQPPSSPPDIEMSIESYIHPFIVGFTQPIIALDPNAQILDCNEPLLSLYGLTEVDFLHQNYFDLCERLAIPMPAESIVTLLGLHTNAITTHNVKPNLIKIYQWTTFTISLADTTDIHFLLGHDITEILDIATKEQLLRDSLIDYIPAQIFWKDKDLVYLGCNKAFVKSLGLNEKGDVIGKTDFDLPVDEKDSMLYRVDDLHIMSSQEPKLDMEESQSLIDGGRRVLSTSKVPLVNKHGTVYGVLGIYRDVTEQKQIENMLTLSKHEAEKASYAKSEFIANMSHDIRTPLSGVVGMAQLLVDALSNPEHKQYARWIHESGIQLLGLLNDILSVISADKLQPSDICCETFSLRQCVYDIIQLERPSTEMKGITLDVLIDDDIPDSLVSDRAKLYRILLNLFGNAIKFTNVGSVGIEIKKQNVGVDQIELKFRVMDTGIGIPKELQDKVFERFYRANPSYKGVYSGHGIGLHIARSYIESLGGELKLTSKVGVGTTFDFNLVFKTEQNQTPISDSDSPLAKQTATSHSYAESEEQPTVLLVEDNYVALKVLESIVKLAKLNFISACDAESALEIATTQPLHLIITDLGLPGMSGNELTTKIRAWERMQHRKPIPIVGLTAHAREQIREECTQAGMNDAYSKPMDLATMRMIVAEFIH
ncbi:MAG: ATP-binding protein [Legionellaceae bacterium]|nr:ATP-binding protein [Legionellaceae bacterium]